ncbi:helix-turn-helix domain-containing protein [Neptunitalea lumnitzerae]|uniref:Transcriptional regulator n=1 Tax=Neptunitalea lumnitzerae TaxID=2965509 RepID=A0ABQ5MKH6_9FLAO|nr:helix-turn-helix domain-containing protein [Neptunitalea sp. Y10]GLB49437.1 transcriptional regulator [Neptunitalea sp. Y10]
MAKKETQEILQLNNLKDFRKQYLSFDKRLDCEGIRSSETEQVTGFFEITRLEQMALRDAKAQTFFERRNFYSIVLLTKGQMKVQIGQETYNMKCPSLYFVAANQLHSIQKCTGDLKGYHLIFDEDYYLLCLRNQIKLSNFIFFITNTVPMLSLQQGALDTLLPLIEKMELDYCRRTTFKDDLLVKLYLNVFLIELEKLYEFQQDKATTTQSKTSLLVAQFQNLVKQHYIKVRQVSDYAKMLYVTPHYLNDVIRTHTGTNASSYINAQVTIGAKAMIIQTDNTFAEIAAQLLFSNPSYFSKFFKKQTGYTPLQYRQLYLNNQLID